MAIREVSKSEYTKDGRKWVYEANNVLRKENKRKEN